MWLLRIGKLQHWQDRDPATGVKDLMLRQGETGLSVYKIADESIEAERVATIFAGVREGPENSDYVLFSMDVVAKLGLTIAKTDAPGTHPFLVERHHEILGLSHGESDGALALATAIARSDEMRAARISRERVIDTLRALAKTDPLIAEHLRKPRWARKLQPP
jgi:hypothetical protein